MSALWAVRPASSGRHLRWAGRLMSRARSHAGLRDQPNMCLPVRRTKAGTSIRSIGPWPNLQPAKIMASEKHYQLPVATAYVTTAMPIIVIVAMTAITVVTAVVAVGVTVTVVKIGRRVGGGQRYRGTHCKGCNKGENFFHGCSPTETSSFSGSSTCSLDPHIGRKSNVLNRTRSRDSMAWPPVGRPVSRAAGRTISKRAP